MTMRVYLAGTLASLAITIGWVAGCGSKSSPTGPTVSGSPPTVTALTIKGNAALTAPGQTSQLTLEATLSDGSKKDVTSTARWSSTNRNVVTVSPGGLATAVDFGKANISGSTEDGRGPGALVFVMTVLPEGTYIVAGRVTEVGNFSIAAARVETIGGPMSGRVVMTDQFGNYAFNGVSGVVQVRATKDGYQPATQNVSPDTENVNVQLTPTVAYAAIGGVYRLTFKAAESCQLPNDAVSRTYTATIAEMGARLTITLSDAQFSASGNLIDGRVYGDTVSLMLNSDYYCHYSPRSTCVAEKLGDMRYLTLIGTAAGTVTGATISTLFAGSVSVLDTPTNTSKPIATCAAPDHQLIFTRRATT